MIYKKLSFGLMATYLIIVIHLLTEDSRYEWSSILPIGGIMFMLGSIAIHTFFHSRKEAIEQFFNQPNAKSFCFILMSRRKK